MTYYNSLLPALVNEGYCVRVIEGSANYHLSEANQAELSGVRVETLERHRLVQWESRFHQFAATPNLKKSIAASWAMWEQALAGPRFDLVEVVDYGLGFIAPLVSSKVPMVLQMHGSQGQISINDPKSSRVLDGLLELTLETVMGRYPAAVQTYSAGNAEFWARQMDREVTCLRPAWIPIAQPVNRTPSTGRVSVFGRVQRWKGPHILCEALRILGPNAPLVDWYGRDTSFDTLDVTCSGWLQRTYPEIWGKKIIWRAPVSPIDVANIQAASVLNVVPSTWDVFNFTAVEAMASKTPVICSASAGAAELIVEGERPGCVRVELRGIRHPVAETKQRIAVFFVGRP